MVAINAELLHELALLYQHGGDGLVTVQAGEAKRSLQVAQGHLVGAESNLKAERIGDMLAAAGKLDPDLVERIAAEARSKGRLFGDQLLADGLLQPTDLAAALENQALLRFEHALSMAGKVSVGPKATARPSLRLTVGSLVVAAFRAQLPVEAIETYTANHRGEPKRLLLTADGQAALKLLPAELRLCRRLAAQETLRALLEGLNSTEPVMRFVGALVALELWA